MKRTRIIGFIVSFGMVSLISALLLVAQAAAGICPSPPCVDSADLIDLQVKTVDLGAGVVTRGKLKNNAVTGAKVLDGSLAGTDIQDGSVSSADIADGTISSGDIAAGACGMTQIADAAVTSAKIASGAVGSAQIADGSVASSDMGFNYAGSASKGGPASDLSCVGCVSQTELNFLVPGKPAHRLVVATSGGDYTSISAALAAVSPTASDPYVIDVMPGTYTKNVTMKSYVHLRGAGREVTTLQSPSPSSDVITLNSLTNVTISDLAIKGGSSGIYNSISSPAITGNTITGNVYYGIYNNSSSPTITGNTITGNSYDGIYNYTSSPAITGNTITGNSGYGIYNYFYSSPQIIHNRITDNGGATYPDIYVSTFCGPNISFNIYDDITGTTGKGMYNVNSSGGAAPAP